MNVPQDYVANIGTIINICKFFCIYFFFSPIRYPISKSGCDLDNLSLVTDIRAILHLNKAIHT